MDYLFHIITLIIIYSILSSSLNLVIGYTGMLSISHAAFFGIGAYTTAILSIYIQSTFFLNLLCSVVVCSIIGAIVGLRLVRICDEYFIICTFAFQIIFGNLMNNLINITGGPMGLPGIPVADFFGIIISSRFGFLCLIIFILFLILWIIYKIVTSPIGRIIKAIREDELLAKIAGKNVFFYKNIIFIISAGIAATAGTIYAHYISFVDPGSFTLMESIFIMTIVIVGGAGSFLGPLIGSIVLALMPEFLRFIGLPNYLAANIRQIIYGSLLVAFMVWRPKGLIGDYDFSSSDKLR